MKASLIQYFLACVIAAVSVAIERCSGSLVVRDFVADNGLILISAFFAINIATLAAILPMLRSLEESHFEPGKFQKTRTAALGGVREMLGMTAIFYILMALAPEKYWCTCTTNKNCVEILASWMFCVFSRACIFQTAYATYDFSRLLIKLSGVK